MKKFLKIPNQPRPDIVISADDLIHVERHNNTTIKVFYSHGGKINFNHTALSNNYGMVDSIIEQMQQAVEDSVSPISELKSKKYYTVSVDSVVLTTDNPVAYSMNV